jgi:large subunit ribosomal protein L19
MESVIKQIEARYKKHAVVDVRPGDTVRVHQKIREGNKERVQVFEGLVLRVTNKQSLTSTITVRRIASGIGVEKTYLLHSPAVVKVEVTKRSKVRRNYLTYMRERTGKAARLAAVDFNKDVNDVPEDPAVLEAERLAKEEAAKEHEAEAAKKAAEDAEAEAKVEAAKAAHDEAAA